MIVLAEALASLQATVAAQATEYLSLTWEPPFGSWHAELVVDMKEAGLKLFGATRTSPEDAVADVERQWRGWLAEAAA